VTSCKLYVLLYACTLVIGLRNFINAKVTSPFVFINFIDFNDYFFFNIGILPLVSGGLKSLNLNPLLQGLEDSLHSAVIVAKD
jgi:hypothetical protein